MPLLREQFASAFELSERRWDPLWRAVIHWEDVSFLPKVLDLIDNELEPRWNRRAHEELCGFAAALVNGTLGQTANTVDATATHQLRWIRFHVSTQLLQMSNSAGRFSMAFNWITVSLSDAEYRQIAPGDGVEATFEQSRLLEFLESDVEVIRCDAQLRVPLWIDQFYYYVMRTGGHQAVARELQSCCVNLVLAGIDTHQHLERWVVALCQIASWAVKAGADQAGRLAQVLADNYDEDLPVEVKKQIGITLAGHVGSLLPQATAVWAQRTLQDCGGILIAHERLQLLVGSCQTPTDYITQAETLIEAAKTYSNSARAHSRDYADLCYGQTRLFNIIAPFALALLREREVTSLVRLLSIWFGSETINPRNSNILFILPNCFNGALFGTAAESWSLDRDAAQALREIVEAGNEFLGTSVVSTGLVDVTEPSTHQISTNVETNSLFEQALIDFYVLEQLQPRLPNLAQEHIGGMCVVPGFQHPIQAVMLKQFGVTWPLVLNFDEPKPYRVLRRALLFTAGTTTGEYAVQGVTDYLRGHEIACDTVINQSISPEAFLERYASDDYDLVWIEAHGEFNSNDPHKSRILLGWGDSVAVTAEQMLKCTRQAPNRRMLILNICEGGTPLVFDAPPKLGIAPLLTGASQSVISHMWPVRSDIAPVFGLLVAIGYRTTQDWFQAYCFAMNSLRSERIDLVNLLTNSAGTQNAIVDRASRGSGPFAEEKICFWGSPVFYE